MTDASYMHRALELAQRARGFVEPNPMVGCVIERGGEVVGEGYHQRFGGPHAEIEALQNAGERAQGSTLYVTLEPCCHFGKTPPCTKAVIAAGVKRVVAAMRDPFPQVAGGGFEELRRGGIEVVAGILQEEAEELNAPYLKLLRDKRPWVSAKWAMTLDGKLATSSGQSKWISGQESRAIVQQLRSRVDAIIVGRRTAELDDPLLTARLPAGEMPRRIATRIVVDSAASHSLSSQLVRTVREAPVLIAASKHAAPAKVQQLQGAGVDVLQLAADSPQERLGQLLDELGRRRMTNVLVEGGSQLLGSFFDARQIDEVHCFIAPKIFGGERSPSPVAGAGVGSPELALQLSRARHQQVGQDLYVHGRLKISPPDDDLTTQEPKAAAG